MITEIVIFCNSQRRTIIKDSRRHLSQGIMERTQEHMPSSSNNSSRSNRLISSSLAILILRDGNKGIMSNCDSDGIVCYHYIALARNIQDTNHM